MAEYGVLADGRRVPHWTVWGDSPEDALAVAKREQERHGGVGTLSVVKMVPMCANCGFRHTAPPAAIAPNSYCR